MVDKNEYPDGNDVNKVELLAYWNIDENGVDTVATYEVSRDGGNEFQEVSMERIGNSDTFRCVHTFTPETLVNNNFGAGTPNLINETTYAAGLPYVSFTLTESNLITVGLEFERLTGSSPEGGIRIVVVKDDGGSPSTNIEDVVYTSPYQRISELPLDTPQLLEFAANYSGSSGTYWVTWELSAAAEANLSPATTFQFNSTGVFTERPTDLRVRITSGTAGALLKGYGVLYAEDQESQIIYGANPDKRQVFTFDGTVDNTNEFTLSWTPDPTGLYCYEIGTGQVYRRGAFTTSGNVITFEPSTFFKSGTVTLEFIERESSLISADASIQALLAANHLGSIDTNIDLSVAGRGFFLRRPDGTLREITINDNDVIEIFSV
jgi:hypothetical protein